MNKQTERDQAIPMPDQSAGKSSADQTQRLMALLRVSRALGTSLDHEQSLNQVMDAVIELTGAQRGFLVLLAEDAADYEIRAARNLEHENLTQAEMQISRSVIEDVIASGQGVVTTNALSDPRFAEQESVILYSLRSILCVPLLVRGKSSGVIYVDNKAKQGLFDQQDLEILASFAGPAAVAIENARLYTLKEAALAERVTELETLQRIDRELNTGLDFDRALDLTLGWALRGTHADRGWIAMKSSESSPMVVVAGEGKGQPIELAGDMLIDGHLLRTKRSDDQPGQLIVPVTHEGEMIAMIGICHDHGPLLDDSREFLLRLADHAGVAFANNRLHRDLQHANQAKSQFVSLISHELKIPMTSIRGYADLIRHGLAGEVSPKQVEYLETIGANVERMARLVADLSDISRIEMGNLEIKLQSVALLPLIELVSAELQPQLDTKEQQVEISLAEAQPTVYADQSRLTQVLINLISNASKYSPVGATIRLSAVAADDAVELRVADKGIGISPDDQPHVFSQFFRSEDPKVRHEQGWGLGLHLTRNLVELMGGEIALESELGVGSTFWITLPAGE